MLNYWVVILEFLFEFCWYMQILNRSNVISFVFLYEITPESCCCMIPGLSLERIQFTYCIPSPQWSTCQELRNVLGLFYLWENLEIYLLEKPSCTTNTNPCMVGVRLTPSYIIWWCTAGHLMSNCDLYMVPTMHLGWFQFVPVTFCCGLQPCMIVKFHWILDAWLDTSLAYPTRLKILI